MCSLVPSDLFSTNPNSQCLFKTLPEILKSRQGTKVPVNLKRRAPSTVSAEPENIKTNSEQTTLPHRSTTFPTHMMQQSPVVTPSRRQKSLDTSQSNRPSDNGSQSAWMASTPEFLTEAMATPEAVSSSSQNPSLANQDPSNLAWSQQFNNPNNLPDLMPMMFPSDDPFAYPTQPMSTLEDDHFRHDRSGMTAGAFPFESASQTGMANSPSDPSVTTPGFDFANLPNFGAPTGVKSSVPSRLQTSAAQPMNSPRIHSPISQGNTPSEALSSPDLVSIPNQNFVWQGYNFQPTNMAAEQPVPQEQSAPIGLPDFNMGLDENSLGMNMDLGISFDDLFGNDATCRPGNGAPNDEWTQWMNPGV